MLLAKAIVIVCFSLFIARIWYQMNTIVHVNLVLKPLFSFHSFSFLIHLVWITLCWLFLLSLSIFGFEIPSAQSVTATLLLLMLWFTRCCYAAVVVAVVPLVKMHSGILWKRNTIMGSHRTVPCHILLCTNMCYSVYFSIVCAHTCQPCSNSSYCHCHCYQLLMIKTRIFCSFLFFFSIFQLTPKCFQIEVSLPNFEIPNNNKKSTMWHFEVDSEIPNEHSLLLRIFD